MENSKLSIFDKIYNWARANSLTPLIFSSSCCEVELMNLLTSSENNSVINYEEITNSPRHADLLIVSGVITHKNAKNLLKIFEQMPEPKYVIAIGACACSGGMYNLDSYSVVKGVDKILPVDVYIPMCPPNIEVIEEGLFELQNKIKNESKSDRSRYKETPNTKFNLDDKVDILTVIK